MLSTQIEPRTARRTLSPRVAYAHVAAVIGLALFASGTPSPLYGTYRELWGFSPLVLTLIYATYAFGVLASLLLAGRVSDEVGRRPVLLVALGDADGRDACCSCSPTRSPGCSSRAALQGLATGLALGAASAALLDLHPRRDPAGVGLTNGVVSAGGLGLGVARLGGRSSSSRPPRACCRTSCCSPCSRSRSPARCCMPEPVDAHGRAAADAAAPERPAGRPPPVPARRARRHLLAGRSAGCSSRSARALGARSSHTDNHSSPASASSRWPARARSRSCCSAAPRRGLGAAAGSLALAAGMLLIVLAAVDGLDARCSAIGAVVGGAGFGVAFLGGLRALSAAIPPAAPRRRSCRRSTSSPTWRSRCRRSSPACSSRRSGWSRRSRSSARVVAALALVVAFEAWRTRPVVRPALAHV